MRKDCPLCKGTGFVREGEVVTFCNCRFSTDTVNVTLRIPKRYWNASIEQFLPDTPSQHEALDESKRYCMAERFKEGEGLIYVGPPSVGKTYLAVSVLKHIYVEHKIRGLFFDTKDLLFIIRGLIDTGRDKDLLKLLVDIPVLLLDDLGNERLSDWHREILSYIIVQRYNYVKPTIITTNYPLYSGMDNAESLEERFGKSIVSKLEETSTIISI